MDLRASSTALDTVVFVLLVGVAVTALIGADVRGQAESNRVAEETADVLATSTAEVTHTRSVRVESPSLLPGGSDEGTVSVTRTARGTYAQLLGAAAVADPLLDGSALFGTGGELRSKSRQVARQVLHTREANVQLAVAWRPYPNAPLESSFTAGDPPPRDADVSITTVTVASGTPNVSAEARQAARAGGYGGVARIVSEAAIDATFPVSSMRAAFFSEGPDRALTAHRYKRASNALSVDVTGQLRRREFEAANRRLAGGLAERLEPDLRQRYDSPAAAARAVRVHQIRIVVRTWSP